MTRKRWLLAPVYSLLCSLCIGVDGLRIFTLGAEYMRGSAAIGFALSEVRFDDTTKGLETTPFVRFSGNRARRTTIRLSHRF